jgi:hypothetical protein
MLSFNFHFAVASTLIESGEGIADKTQAIKAIWKRFGFPSSVPKK